MRIQNATISAIKADIAKAELAVTIKVHLNQETMATAQELSNYTGEDPTRMDIHLYPHQLRLFNEAGVPPTLVSESDLEEEHNVIIDDEPDPETGELGLTEEEKSHLVDVKKEIEGSWEPEEPGSSLFTMRAIDPDSPEGIAVRLAATAPIVGVTSTIDGQAVSGTASLDETEEK